jgi:hypothetical protein
MRLTFRWLCWSSLTLAALACGSEPEKPCLSADAAAGRCQAKPAAPAQLRPGEAPPEQAVNLCKDWHRPDGSCDPMQILADYQECLTQKGLPEQKRMFDQHVGNRNVIRSRDRATFLCLELRKWFMTDGAEAEWKGLPRPPDPPAAPPP